MQVRSAAAWLIICLLSFKLPAYSQAERTLQGAIFKKGSIARVANARVYNKRTNQAVTSNGFGIFSILAARGDSLSISHNEYNTQTYVVYNFQDAIIYLPSSNLLSEVIVKGETMKDRLKEAEESFRKQGIFYKGKPPLTLLLPFGGSPLTFLHERFGQDGKRARRFYKFAKRELEYNEISKRFNDKVIRQLVSIEDEDLPDFKNTYQPDIEQLRNWADFDLYRYIKVSYQDFLAKKSQSH